MEENKMDLKCDCGCGYLSVSHFDDDNLTILSYYPAGFYAFQQEWKDSLKLIWNVLRGRKYQLFELVIPDEKWEEFKAFVNSR